MRRIFSPRAGQIVYRENKGNREILIRYSRQADAAALRGFINTISKERIFLQNQGEQFSIAEERKWLAGRLRHLRNKTGIHLLLFVNGALAGGSTIDMKDKIHAHVGRFGIALGKPFRGIGLGRLLMKAVLQEAVKLPGIRIVELELFAANKRAYGLYRSMGFKQYGRIPGGVRHRDRYVDEVFMYKRVR